ncbi:hypothetical protein PHLCEN_2v9340 [Hermanssonia centrifuga]|uniref:Uncharacterized protein n=1 Tax=Hermanssonia centrifuga TaxID=98765 RepID=A0A2R6NR29_9APHY|nr:hypothetical protein PHLCEN_2v9340 [Hermanssonia centrifuga]
MDLNSIDNGMDSEDSDGSNILEAVYDERDPWGYYDEGNFRGVVVNELDIENELAVYNISLPSHTHDSFANNLKRIRDAKWITKKYGKQMEQFYGNK